MITAVDSSVILDLVTADPRFAALSEAALHTVRVEGKVVVCECVIAEILPALGGVDRLHEFLADLQMEFLEICQEAAELAGRYFADYLRRGGGSGRVLADFLIGAHAHLQADRLLARDRGYFRDYFRDLEVLDPSR